MYSFMIMFKSLKSLLKLPCARGPMCWASTPADREVTQTHRCQFCDICFSSAKRLSGHIFQKHHLRNPIRQFIDTTSCPICLLEFGSVERVVRHLSCRKDCPVNKCRTAMMLFFPTLAPDQLNCIDEASRQQSHKLMRAGHRETYAERPAVRLQGPLQKFAVLVDECLF